MIPSSTNTNKRYFFIFIRKILLFIDFSAKVDKKKVHIFLFAKLHFIISRRHAEMFLEDGRRAPLLHVRTL